MKFQIQQAKFTRNFLIARLIGRYVVRKSLKGVSHANVGLKTTTFFLSEEVLPPTTITCDSTTFFLSEGILTPTTIACDQRLPWIPLVSQLQAHCALRKGIKCALLYLRVTALQVTMSNISQGRTSKPSSSCIAKHGAANGGLGRTL